MVRSARGPGERAVGATPRLKSLNGRPTDVSPTGAAARESVFLQSYRAELAHFLAVLQGDTKYEPPSDRSS